MSLSNPLPGRPLQTLGRIDRRVVLLESRLPTSEYSGRMHKASLVPVHASSFSQQHK